MSATKENNYTWIRNPIDPRRRLTVRQVERLLKILRGIQTGVNALRKHDGTRACGRTLHSLRRLGYAQEFDNGLWNLTKRGMRVAMSLDDGVKLMVHRSPEDIAEEDKQLHIAAATEAMAAHAKFTNSAEDVKENFRDLMADLMYFAEVNQIDFLEELNAAQQFYQERL